MFQEYDVVKLVKTIGNVPKGTIGAIVMIHPDTPTHYLVEFVDKQGNTMDLLTVSEEDIEFYKEG